MASRTVFRRRVLIGILLTGAAACDPRGKSGAALPAEGVAVAAEGAPSAGARRQTFGAPVEAAPFVPLAELAKKRASHRGQTVASSGTVTFVCQEKGCFMEVEDHGVEANVRVRDHAFSLPKDAAGRTARFVGRVTYLWEGRDTDDAHLDKAMIELDATGVELF